jgi:hypothetical protein
MSQDDVGASLFLFQTPKKLVATKPLQGPTRLQQCSSPAEAGTKQAVPMVRTEIAGMGATSPRRCMAVLIHHIPAR